MDGTGADLVAGQLVVPIAGRYVEDCVLPPLRQADHQARHDGDALAGAGEGHRAG